MGSKSASQLCRKDNLASECSPLKTYFVIDRTCRICTDHELVQVETGLAETRIVQPVELPSLVASTIRIFIGLPFSALRLDLDATSTWRTKTPRAALGFMFSSQFVALLQVTHLFRREEKVTKAHGHARLLAKNYKCLLLMCERHPAHSKVRPARNASAEYLPRLGQARAGRHQT